MKLMENSGDAAPKGTWWEQWVEARSRWNATTNIQLTLRTRLEYLTQFSEAIAALYRSRGIGEGQNLNITMPLPIERLETKQRELARESLLISLVADTWLGVVYLQGVLQEAADPEVMKGLLGQVDQDLGILTRLCWVMRCSEIDRAQLDSDMDEDEGTSDAEQDQIRADMAQLVVVDRVKLLLREAHMLMATHDFGIEPDARATMKSIREYLKEREIQTMATDMLAALRERIAESDWQTLPKASRDRLTSACRMVSEAIADWTSTPEHVRRERAKDLRKIGDDLEAIVTKELVTRFWEALEKVAGQALYAFIRSVT